MRIVMDTDVMVAAFRSRRGASRQWLKASLKRQVAIVLSVPLVLQYEAVLLRAAQLAAMRATRAQVGAVLDALCKICVPVEISFLWRPVLRDPDDEMVLEAAIHGQVDALLTFNEKDFTGARRFGVVTKRPGPAWKHYHHKEEP